MLHRSHLDSIRRSVRPHLGPNRFAITMPTETRCNEELQRLYKQRAKLMIKYHAKLSLLRLQISEWKMALDRVRKTNMHIGRDPDGASTAKTSTMHPEGAPSVPSPAYSGPSHATVKMKRKMSTAIV